MLHLCTSPTRVNKPALLQLRCTCLLLLSVQIRLKHKDTGMLMSSNANHRFGQPIHGHQEVCGINSRGKDTEWFAAEGVYLPRSDRKAKDSKAAKDEL